MAHVFISYVREDSETVEKLCDSLRENGIRVWIDRIDIPPGSRWKKAIRKAINEGDFFIACFSPHYLYRNATYMNEELTLAIEILRQKPIDHAWFIPVLLAKCEVPDREIGAGETLLDIQQVYLYENWETGISRIVSVIKPNVPNSDAEDYRKGTDGDTISVLFLAANPVDRHPLRLGEELRGIQIEILQSKLRDRFHLEMRMAVRLEDLQEALMTLKPRIVHFTGHGTQSGIILEDEFGKSKQASTVILASLFEAVRDHVQCVVLNVTYSSELARAIAKQIKYVIGMEGPLSDKAAIAFATGFYQALAHERSIDEAFELANVGIALKGLSHAIKPLLITNG